MGVETLKRTTTGGRRGKAARPPAQVEKPPVRKRRPRSGPAAVPERSPTVEELDQSEVHSIVGYALRRAQTAVYQDYARTVAELDVRPAQYAALSLVVANPGMSQSTLAQAMGIDRSGAVALIDALEEKGLAMRVQSPADRRTHAIMPTRAGENMLEELRVRVREHDRRVTAKLSSEERDLLVGLLRRIYE